MVRSVTAMRYVTPLREGGSLPGIVEADDDGLYVVKFRGAGHGPRALVAEYVAGEIARHLGLRVPELVEVLLDPALGRAEPDYEIRQLVLGSEGSNVGLDYLPGSLTYDPASDPLPDPELAADIVWLDSFVTNIDRGPQNPNLLMWHGDLWLIDHGATLYVHANWYEPEAAARQPFEMIAQHVLLPAAGSIVDADARNAPRIDRALLEHILASVPDSWFEQDALGREAAEVRGAYVTWLLLRLDAREQWVPVAEAARVALEAGA
ncbi:MAG: hypothetical protein JWM25_1180 [Thermoleophilia bacterium]|nr:hypothetical protein [Thermoleophilia bacterium]MCZ4496597.1 hypothetical protein [Thermoleophilia bacterium]